MLIRRKITLALIITNLVVIATVGIVAYYSLRQKFNDQIAATALANFRSDAISFIETYGSWEAGVAAEPFDAFVARRSRQTNRPIAIGLAPAVTPPVFPDAAPAALAPITALNSPPPAHSLSRPPFHFMIFSPEGKVLKAIPPYQVGATISAADRANAQPIEHAGKLLAYVVAKGDAAYSALDLGYLTAIRQALWLGVGAALALAVAVGWLLGSRLSARLGGLTRAIESVHTGDFGRQVDIGADDEIGILAKAFNRMSDELQRGREALKTSQRRIEKQTEMLRELADRDALTQLHNRRFFDEQVAELDHNGKSVIVLGDVDHFKWINDRYSHATGDSVLRQIGAILHDNTRRTDIVARYGGEEFVVAFADVTQDQAYALCEKLRRAIADHPWQRIDPGLQVTMSFGLAAMNDASRPEDALKSADRSLYRAKAEGRNRVCVAPNDG